MSIITSKRTFGVEIEFIAPSSDSLRKIASKYNVVPDGSLRPHPHAGEYVSQVLQGASGERTIEQVCMLMKSCGVDIEDPRTSVHVHLDAGVRSSVSIIKTRRRQEGETRQIAISNALIRKGVQSSNIERILINRTRDLDLFERYYTTEFNGVRYYSLAELSKEPRINYTFFSVKTDDRFEWLKRVLYFYTKYSAVFEKMVSPSRQSGNMYCIPLHEAYDLEDILKTKDMDDLRRVWYKNTDGSRHHDDSRYHSVNLHSVFTRPGTVEFRSHGGTVDPYKILLWVKLHQYILDRLEDVDINTLISLQDDAKSLIEFVDDDVLRIYIKRLLGFFSGIKIK